MFCLSFKIRNTVNPEKLRAKVKNSHLLDSIFIVRGWISNYREKGVGYFIYREGKYTIPLNKYNFIVMLIYSSFSQWKIMQNAPL